MKNDKERIDIRVPISLLKEIDKYQLDEGISNRTTAMLELIRLGLNMDHIEENKHKNEKKRIDIRVPVGLIQKIEEYQHKHNISTRTGTMIVLTEKGLTTVYKGRIS